MQTKPALLMPDARHSADPAATLPKNQRKSICILDEAVVGTVSDGQHAAQRLKEAIDASPNVHFTFGVGGSSTLGNF